MTTSLFVHELIPIVFIYLLENYEKVNFDNIIYPFYYFLKYNKRVRACKHLL